MPTLKSGNWVKVKRSLYPTRSAGYLLKMDDFAHHTVWEAIVCDFDPFKPGWLFVPFHSRDDKPPNLVSRLTITRILGVSQWHRHKEYQGAWTSEDGRWTLCPIQAEDVIVLEEGFASMFPGQPTAAKTRRGRKHRMRLPERVVEL